MPRLMPRLSERARHFVVPDGIVSTGWPSVVARGAELGIHFDWWQDTLGKVALGKRTDGRYAATVGGVVLSIPRQVGKTWFVGALLIIICTLFPNTRVLWTAHHLRTSTNSFRTMQGICRRKKVAPHIADIRLANGEQEIVFRNGSIIMFGARSLGFGRGFDKIDFEVFDEAQILNEKALEDMVAATNQARHPAGALLFYMGTPPRPSDPGEAFTLKRSRAIAGKTKDLLYLECSAKPDADLDDQEQWKEANFSFPDRTPLESMLRLRENLGNDDSWRREGLGIWDEFDATERILPAVDWDLCLDVKADRSDDFVYALAVGEDLRAATIAASDGTVVHVIEWRRGSEWLPAALAKVVAERPAPVWLYDKGPTGALLSDLDEAGIEWQSMKGTDYAQACGALHFAVTEGYSLRHTGQATLDIAVAHAVRKNHSDAWVWDRRKSTVDISPLEAVTIARWAALQGAGKQLQPIAIFT
jgi:hypothetical protein